jgi:hypothetical protein
MTDPRDNRVDHAAKQLDDATSLFLQGHFDSAWRFAATADEILRKALSDSGENSFEREYQPSIITEAEDVALWMIVRACRNYDLLGLPRTAKGREFQDWFDEHVVGQGQFYDDVVGVV